MWIKISDENSGTYALEQENPGDVVTIEQLDVKIAGHDSVIAQYPYIEIPVTASPETVEALEMLNDAREEIRERNEMLKAEKVRLKNELLN